MRGLWAFLVRYRDFRLLLSAGLVSMAGDWILRVGLTYWVYVLTGSALASAAMLMASLLPQLMLGSIAGIFVDRWDRRRTMIAINLLLAIGLLPLLTVHHAGQVWIVYLVTLWESCLVQFFVPAEAAVVPQLVRSGDLVPANALNSQTTDVARLVGAALGGIVAGLGGMGGGKLLGVLIAGTLADPVGIVPVIAVQGAGYVAGGAIVLLRLSRSSSAWPAAQPGIEDPLAAVR
jgi:MFS family permease